jgi:hypothetical protein
VQLLALAGQQRRVDRLGQQRVAEAEAAGRLHRGHDAVLDRLPQRLAHVALGQRRRGTQQPVAHVAPGGRGQAQQALRRGVEPGHPLQQQVAQPTRQRAVMVAGGGEELLGEEGVALGAGGDLLGQRRRRGRVGVGGEQHRQLIALERSELEHQRRARAPDAAGEPAHALGRGGLVRAVEQQRQGLLEHPQLGARRLPVDPRKASERAQGLDERLERQLRADQVDRAPDEDLEPFVAGTPCQLGRQPGLADARLPGDQDGRAAARPRRVQGAPELPELAYAPDEHLARGSLHPGSIAPPDLAWKAPVRMPRPEDT